MPKSTTISFSVIHKERIYIFSKLKRNHIWCYDMKEYIWSIISLPTKSESKHWRAAVVKDDLFFMNKDLHLYRLDQGKLERIHTGDNTPDLGLFFTLTAVHHWLYIFSVMFDDEPDFKAHCYNTISGIWTDVILYLRASPSVKLLLVVVLHL